MFKRLSLFCAQNSTKIAEWLHPPMTKLEKFNSVLISQLFLVAAALLIYKAEINQRIASWTLICIFEGILLIFAMMLLLNVDSNHKWILRVWPYVATIFKLTVVVVINVQDTAEEIPTVISFLLFPVLCESSSLITVSALAIYGMIMLAINKFDQNHLYCISVSVVNVIITFILRLVVAFNKFSSAQAARPNQRTKTIGRITKPDTTPKVLNLGTPEAKPGLSITTVQPISTTKIRKVVPIYGNKSKASEEDLDGKPQISSRHGNKSTSNDKIRGRNSKYHKTPNQPNGLMARKHKVR